jgi:hypothetical protein
MVLRLKDPGNLLDRKIRQIRDFGGRPAFGGHPTDQALDSFLDSFLDPFFEQLQPGPRFVQWCQFGDHLSNFLPAFGFEAL